MAKPKVSLEKMIESASYQEAKDVMPLQRFNDMPVRRKVSHTSVYLSPRVLKAIKQMALDLDRRPHDLLLEGIDLMLAKHGRPSIAEIDEK